MEQHLYVIPSHLDQLFSTVCKYSLLIWDCMVTAEILHELVVDPGPFQDLKCLNKAHLIVRLYSNKKILTIPSYLEMLQIMFHFSGYYNTYVSSFLLNLYVLWMHTFKHALPLLAKLDFEVKQTDLWTCHYVDLHGIVPTHGKCCVSYPSCQTIFHVLVQVGTLHFCQDPQWNSDAWIDVFLHLIKSTIRTYICTFAQSNLKNELRFC